MKAYMTFAGAKRAANGKPVVRLLDERADPAQLYIVVDTLNMDVMVYTTDGPHSRSYEFAGSTKLFDIAAKVTPDRQELIDELSEAIDDRMDLDVSYSMLAVACVDRLAKLGIVS